MDQKHHAVVTIVDSVVVHAEAFIVSSKKILFTYGYAHCSVNAEEVKNQTIIDVMGEELVIKLIDFAFVSILDAVAEVVLNEKLLEKKDVDVSTHS